MEELKNYIIMLEKLVETLKAESEANKKCFESYEKLSAKQNELIMKREVEIAHLQREIEKMQANPLDIIAQQEAEILFANTVFPNQA